MSRMKSAGIASILLLAVVMFPSKSLAGKVELPLMLSAESSCDASGHMTLSNPKLIFLGEDFEDLVFGVTGYSAIGFEGCDLKIELDSDHQAAYLSTGEGAATQKYLLGFYDASKFGCEYAGQWLSLERGDVNLMLRRTAPNHCLPIFTWGLFGPSVDWNRRSRFQWDFTVNQSGGTRRPILSVKGRYSYRNVMWKSCVHPKPGKMLEGPDAGHCEIVLPRP